MRRIAFSRIGLSFLCVCLLTSVGCNDAGSSTETVDSGNRAGSLPLMSVGDVPPQRQTEFTASEPTLAESTEAVPTEAGSESAPAMSQAEVDLARALKLWEECQSDSIADTDRHDKLMQIVDRTTHAMALSRGQAGQSGVFNMSAVTLANARMELALAADAEDNTHANLLAQNADELFRIDPTSMAATETAFRVVELAREMAERHAHQADTQWTVGYARQSRLFAQRFPQEGNRAPMNLISAAEMSETAGLIDEARQCYLTITNSYADSLMMAQAERSLRRFDLVGQPLVSFAGETLNGGTIDVADLQGHAVIIVFWNAASEEFAQQFEQLQIWKETHGDNLRIVGVNLDTDEAAVRDFVETRGFPGDVMFFSNPVLRGESQPLAVQFAVNNVPSYWLVSSEGIVLGAPIRFDDLHDSLNQPTE